MITIFWIDLVLVSWLYSYNHDCVAWIPAKLKICFSSGSVQVFTQALEGGWNHVKRYDALHFELCIS